MTEVSSESDDRVVNNTVRHEYRVLNETEKRQMLEIKDIGLYFVRKCEQIGPSREISLAITKIEEAVMWAVKSITR